MVLTLHPASSLGSHDVRHRRSGRVVTGAKHAFELRARWGFSLQEFSKPLEGSVAHDITPFLRCKETPRRLCIG